MQIKKIQYLTWFAKEVPVKEPNGKWWICVDFND